MNVVDFVFTYIWKLAKFEIAEKSIQPLPVTLYTDSSTVYLTLLNKHIMESCKDQLIQTTGEFNKKELEKTAFNKLKQIISRVLQSDGSLNIVNLRQQVLNEASDEELTAVETQHQKYLDALKQSGINVVDIADPKNNPSTESSKEKGYNLYSRLAYYFGSREMAERAVRSYLVVNKGGLTIQSGVLPDLDTNRLHDHVAHSLNAPYINRSTGASLVRLIANIFSHAGVIPPLNDDDRKTLEFYQTPNSRSDSDLAKNFFKGKATSAIRQKTSGYSPDSIQSVSLKTN